jgi:hypothetical protein
VTRVIFIATPHRGSFLAENWIGMLGRKLTNAPASLTKSAYELATLSDDPHLFRWRFQIETSIDNMDWSNPGLRTLASLPIAPGVHVNSIIPVEAHRSRRVTTASCAIRGTSARGVGLSCGGSGHSTQAARNRGCAILYQHAGAIVTESSDDEISRDLMACRSSAGRAGSNGCSKQPPHPSDLHGERLLRAPSRCQCAAGTASFGHPASVEDPMTRLTQDEFVEGTFRGDTPAAPGTGLGHQQELHVFYLLSHGCEAACRRRPAQEQAVGVSASLVVLSAFIAYPSTATPTPSRSGWSCSPSSTCWSSS